jgi:hypothetical protein
MLKNPVYVGKIRWREVLYEGQHDPLVSEVLFEKANEVLQERHEDLKGRQWHNGDERLLTGVIKCARCKSHMFGGGGNKKGVHVPYYVCSKRFNDHDCEQDYVRAELLEAAVTEDIKAMFRDEQFMARIWAEANKRLGTEKPILEKEIGKLEAQAAKAQAAMDRYFEAFEAGTLQAELCNEKVRDLRARLEELEGEKRDLEARRERLELPAVDRGMLASLVENFERVMAEGPAPQKKHLLHRLVKKVLVQDRRTVEVWYGLPNPQRFEDWNKWLPKRNSSRHRRRPGWARPEVWFRIVHIAQEGADRAPVAAYREQTVEIALGPKGAFQTGIVGALKRRVAPDQTVNALSAKARNRKPPKPPRTPKVVELLRTAQEWRRQLDAGEVENQAAIARREGITRARVTQIMALTRLAPEIQDHVLSLPAMAYRSVFTERALRPIAQLGSQADQKAQFHELGDMPIPGTAE